MSQILIVAATRAEIQPLIDHYPGEKPFDVLITGVGMVATAFALGKQCTQLKYTLAVNLGIAGSFDRNIALGEVVEVTEDQLAELGAEDGNRFITIDELGFGHSNFSASADAALYLPAGQLKKVNAITVNTVHGNDESVAHVAARLNPQLESMEGAAFFYACGQAGIPCIQIRAVSNYVEKRNRESWKIGLAIKNLNNFAIGFINAVSPA